MSDTPPPPDMPPLELVYETPTKQGNAPTLVRLAAIFQLVTAGIDLMYGMGMLAMAAVMYYAMTAAPAGGGAFVVSAGPGAGPAAVAPAPPAPAPAPLAPVPPVPAPAPPPAAFKLLSLAFYGVPGILSLLAIVPKVVGAIKLLRLRRRAWGWGLAAGIVCCGELWMIQPCCFPLILPLGVGIFSIIVLCLPHVRAYVVGRSAADVAAA